MANGRLKLRSIVKRGTQLPTGKGWRLVRPRQRGVFKAALLKTFRSKGGSPFSESYVDVERDGIESFDPPLRRPRFSF